MTTRATADFSVFADMADAVALMCNLQDVARDVFVASGVPSGAAGLATDPAGRARIAAAYEQVARVARELLTADELAAPEDTPPERAHAHRRLDYRALCLLQSLVAVREEPWFAARPGGPFDAACEVLRSELCEK